MRLAVVGDLAVLGVGAQDLVDVARRVDGRDDVDAVEARASSRISRTSSLVRYSSETIAGSVSHSMRKPRFSEKCMSSVLSFM